MIRFDDLGVSETIGYILVFAIVLTGIAGIVFFGTTMLNDAKDRNNFQNVEQGLTVVQSDMKRVALEKAPVKTSKLRVEGGTLNTDFDTSSIKVEFAGNPAYTQNLGDITFYSNVGRKSLSLENGGLWKAYGGSQNDVCVLPPRIFGSPVDDAVVINVFRLTGEEQTIATTGTINLIMDYVGNDVKTLTSPVPSDLTITIQTAYPASWSRYLDESESMSTFSKEPIEITDSSTKMVFHNVVEVIISEHTIRVEPAVITM